MTPSCHGRAGWAHAASKCTDLRREWCGGNKDMETNAVSSAVTPRGALDNYRTHSEVVRYNGQGHAFPTLVGVNLRCWCNARRHQAGPHICGGANGMRAMERRPHAVRHICRRHDRRQGSSSRAVEALLALYQYLLDLTCAWRYTPSIGVAPGQWIDSVWAPGCGHAERAPGKRRTAITQLFRHTSNGLWRRQSSPLSWLPGSSACGSAGEPHSKGDGVSPLRGGLP